MKGRYKDAHVYFKSPQDAVMRFELGDLSSHSRASRVNSESFMYGCLEEF